MTIRIHVVTNQRYTKPKIDKQIMRYLIKLQPLLIVLIPYFISLLQYVFHLRE